MPNYYTNYCSISRFCRLRNAASGLTSVQLIRKQQEFFSYMEKYFPVGALSSLPVAQKKPPKRPPHSSAHSGGSRPSSSSSTHRMLASTRVQFSKVAGSDETPVDEDSLSNGGGEATGEREEGGVNITHQKGNPRHHQSTNHAPNAITTTASVTNHSGRPPLTSSSSLSSRQSSLVDELGFEHIQYPNPSNSRGLTNPRTSKTRIDSSSPNQWLNSLAARLCWDVWHEQRWKDWVMTRIQKKLIRIKTPSFMEKLRLTDIDIGNDMPTVNRLIGGPRLDLRGIWVYLDVTYQGKFVMTIETKMKLGGKVGGDSGGGKEDEGKQMTAVARSKDDSRYVLRFSGCLSEVHICGF